MSNDFFNANDGAADQSFSPYRAEAIPVDGESVTAFVGPAPRGPTDHAVAISHVNEFDRQFGIPEFPSRMGFAIRQFFANGGRRAVVVRVSASTVHNRICLPAGSASLVLQARNPGPLEFLRASVDYDGIAADETSLFNLVVQRLRTADSAWIEAQECFRALSIDPDSRDFVGNILAQSDLLRLAAEAPATRPEPTIKPGSIREAGYISALAGNLQSPAATDYDLVGSTEKGTGLAALKQVHDVAHLCLISGATDAAIGPVAMLAADAFCRANQALLLVDPPARWQQVDAVVADQRRSDFSSPNAVTWYPSAFVRSAAGDRVMTSATGAVAAALIEADRTRHVERLISDAMVMPRGVLRVAAKSSVEEQQRLHRVGINVLSQRSALHLQLLGNSTQSRHADVVAGGVPLDLRAEILFIARRIRLGTRWVAFHESGPRVWRELSEQLAAFMTGLHARSLLAGSGGTRSWFIKCDQETNRGLRRSEGCVAFTLGFALRRPGEFYSLRYQQAAAACTITELGWQSEQRAVVMLG